MCEEAEVLELLEEGPSVTAHGTSCRSISTNTTDYDGEDTDALKEKVDYLQLKLEVMKDLCFPRRPSKYCRDVSAISKPQHCKSSREV